MADVSDEAVEAAYRAVKALRSYTTEDVVRTALAAVLPLLGQDTAGEVERLRERLDIVTCDVCDELITPGEEVLPTGDSWVHDDCLTEGP